MKLEIDAKQITKDKISFREFFCTLKQYVD